MGDSITNLLQVYTYSHDELGEPLFLTQASYSVRNMVNYNAPLPYGGKQKQLPDALADSGVSRVFIMLGINDIGVVGVDRSIENWDVFIDRIREKCPDIDIYIQSCTPMYGSSQGKELNNGLIDEYNERLRALAEEKGCCFVEVGKYFKDENGDLIPTLTKDYYVHFTMDGCDLWVAALLDPANYSDLKR